MVVVQCQPGLLVMWAVEGNMVLRVWLHSRASTAGTRRKTWSLRRRRPSPKGQMTSKVTFLSMMWLDIMMEAFVFSTFSSRSGDISSGPAPLQQFALTMPQTDPTMYFAAGFGLPLNNWVSKRYRAESICQKFTYLGVSNKVSIQPSTQRRIRGSVVNSSNAGCRDIQVVTKTISNEWPRVCEPNGYRQRLILLEMLLGNVYPRERERVF